PLHGRERVSMKRTGLSLLLVSLILCGLAALELPAAKPPQTEKLPRIEKLQHRSYTEAIPGTGQTFEMVAIPGGAYLMGSPAQEKGRRPDEGPQHPVAIRPFWMCKVEVTWDIFDAYREECGVSNKEAG